MRRLVLCRPQGGLNDMLCQIEKCCRYAERMGRSLVVDTAYRHSQYFMDRLDRYFVSGQSRLFLSAEDFGESFVGLQVFPEFLSGRVNEYTASFDAALKGWHEPGDPRPVTFDFSKDYPHALLVHHQSGGGMHSQYALLRMRVEDALVAELGRRVREIGVPYAAVHIRHTDYASDYQEVLEHFRGTLRGPLFVATDNREVLEEFRLALGRERVYSFACLPPTAGDPLHRGQHPSASAYARNRDAILDLLMLALSKRLHITKLLENPYGATLSGYASLAQTLWSSKILLKTLLPDSGLDFGLG